jgi:hypothetical protein
MYYHRQEIEKTKEKKEKEKEKKKKKRDDNPLLYTNPSQIIFLVYSAHSTKLFEEVLNPCCVTPVSNFLLDVFNSFVWMKKAEKKREGPKEVSYSTQMTKAGKKKASLKTKPLTPPRKKMSNKENSKKEARSPAQANSNYY